MEIELSPAQINNIVTASKLQRKKIVSRYLNDYKLQLEAAANKLRFVKLLNLIRRSQKALVGI